MLRDQLEALKDITPAQHIDAVASLASATGHSMTPLPSSSDLLGYTCAVYALNLVDDRYYDNVRMRHRRIFAGAKFMNWLMSSGRLKPLCEGEVDSGALVVYVDAKGKFMHVGILQSDGRIWSKFGELGLYNHALWEVPTRYGNQVQYFEGLGHAESLEHFLAFAKEEGADVAFAPRR